jgi:hypothetical protein
MMLSTSLRSALVTLRVIIFLALLIFIPPVSTKNACIGTAEIEKSQAMGIQSRTDEANKKYKWAIVALVRAGRKTADTQKRNAMVADFIRPYAEKHSFTMIYFSEEKIPKAFDEGVTNRFKGIADVRFIDTADKGFSLREKYGYKYMCKFFGIDIYNYLREFDFYMRCDTDCFLKKPEYDIFQWAETNHVSYGFALRKLEAHGPTKHLMPKWVSNYMSNCSLQATSPMEYPMSTCFNFYNNWHIGRVLFFLQPDVQHFLHAVNASGHIISDRWGDSTIQAYAVRMFMQESQIRQVPNFVYTHGSHNLLVTTKNKGAATNIKQKLPYWK